MAERGRPARTLLATVQSAECLSWRIPRAQQQQSKRLQICFSLKTSPDSLPSQKAVPIPAQRPHRWLHWTLKSRLYVHCFIRTLVLPELSRLNMALCSSATSFGSDPGFLLYDTSTTTTRGRPTTPSDSDCVAVIASVLIQAHPTQWCLELLVSPINVKTVFAAVRDTMHLKIRVGADWCIT